MSRVFKGVYWIGCIFLFFGLLWSFLPHVYHEKVSHAIDKDLSTPHAIHIIEGVIPLLIGLGLIISANKKLRRANGERGK